MHRRDCPRGAATTDRDERRAHARFDGKLASARSNEGRCTVERLGTLIFEGGLSAKVDFELVAHVRGHVSMTAGAQHLGASSSPLSESS